jgi:hypothetical protein
MIKKTVVRSVRKSAYLSRRILSIGANYSGKIENKAHRIINGTDSAIKLTDQIQFEKLYYESIPYITPVHPALPKADRSPQTVLFIPSLQKSSFFGGTATALIFAALTAKKSGTPLLIIETLKKGRLKIDALREFYLQNDIDLDNEIEMEISDISPRKYNQYGYINLHPDDIIICSAWWDAYLVERLPLVKKFIYLIQDYEPIFYNNSDMYLLAESTYRSNKYLPVCNTQLMLKFMTQKGYDYIAKHALFFEPAINIGQKLGLDKKNKSNKKIMFIYGRPSVERNLFYTALKSVEEIFTEQSLNPADWECYMAGQDGVSNILFESGVQVTNLGKMDINDYYKFAKGIDLAVSLMLAPHPSYPPLELSSLGAAVVTTKYETKKDLKTYNENIFIADATIKDIKQKIIDAAKLSIDKRTTNAKKTNLESRWDIALNPVVEKALQDLG